MDTEVNDYNSSQNNDTEIEKKSEISIPSGIYNNNNNNTKSAFTLYDEDSEDEVSIFKVKTQEILKKITQNLVTTYSECNPDFDYELNANPRRVLTKPSKPVHNDGYDNENWDYILYVNDILGGQEGQQYQILDILGKGTFGQVVKCQNVKTKEIVALKVIKNKPAYYNQSLVEVAILDILNNQYDKEDKHNIIRLKDTFIFHGHLCIIFEMLSVNLYELIKQNQFRGLSTNLVRVFVSQLLDALCVLNKSKIIHCDLKPENILLRNLESPALKVIDFGSACHENQTTYTYIQSRFYRSIEVLLGLPYTSSIDMWSLGCIAAELYLGLPLFPGSSEYNQVSRIVNMLGIPPLYTIEKGKNAHKYFKKVGVRQDGKAIYKLKSMEEYMEENNVTEQPSKIYFNGDTLDEIINLYPITRKGLSQREIDKEMQNRTVFIDFLHGLLNLNPLERWSPQEARYHPFITGEKYLGPYVPSTRIKSVPMSIPLNSYSNNSSVSNSSTPITISTKSNTRRPRANTISSSRVQNVPPQLQRLAAFNPQNNNTNSSNYYANGPTQYQIIQQQSLSEMANLENISSTMNNQTDNSRFSALLNNAGNDFDSALNGANYGQQTIQTSQIPTPNQQILTMNGQQPLNIQNDAQYISNINNIFSDMHIDPYNLNINSQLSSSLDNLSSSNQRRIRNNRRMDYNISTKHFRRQSFAGSSFSYLNSMNNTRSNSTANISQNPNTDSNFVSHNSQSISNLSKNILNHNSYSSGNLLNIPEHQDFSNNDDINNIVDHSSNIISPLNLPEQSFIPNSSSMNHVEHQLYMSNSNAVNSISEHSYHTPPADQNQKQSHHTRRVRYKSGPAETNVPIGNAATNLFMYNNPTQSMSYQSLPDLMSNSNAYSNSYDMDNATLYHMNTSNSTSSIPGLNQTNPNSAFHYTYNVAIDPQQQAPQQNAYFDPTYHDKFLSSYLFQKRHSVPTLHFMTKNTNLKSSNNYSTNYNSQDYSGYSMTAQQPPTYVSNNNSYEDMPLVYGSGSKINKGKSFLGNKMINNNKNYSNSSSAININNSGMNKYPNYYQNSSLSKSLTNIQMMDPSNSSNNVQLLSSSTSSNNNNNSNNNNSINNKKYYIDKSQKNSNNLKDIDSNNFYTNRNRSGSLNFQQHKSKGIDNTGYSNSYKNKNSKQSSSILSEKEAFASKENSGFSSFNENDIRYEDENDHNIEEEDDIVEVEVNYDEDNYEYDEDDINRHNA
ncbi:kinase-like protein [Neocallimastix lanati (nom. inval.)]|uniref:Kinase-like protein n=1 Tax=Neocallimastix californiae TaxID=1754190 RepID=A0A1Y2CSZ0_9FUNG|nr:kinase-like protein [Neocallimastix sp. JGI-2020a]ORY50131.1 kinase-like protein [Neocallimastix californiae]|eukprot:ORY50131.1 kinase-like protein [Neocallimastix californiae]